MIKVRVGNVICARNTYTRGSTLYLVLFADPNCEYIQCVRIMGSDNQFGGDDVKVSITEDSFGFCNVFTGLKAISKDSVDSILHTITSDEYDKIVNAITSVMRGEYRKDFRGRFMISPSVEVDDMDTFEEVGDTMDIKNTLSEVLSGINSIKELISSTGVHSPSDTNEVEVITEQPISTPTTLRFDAFRTNEERFDWLYEMFAINDRLNISKAYGQLVLRKNNSERHDNIVLTRDEFIMVASCSVSDISKYPFMRVNGTSDRLKQSAVGAFKTKVIHLLNGTSPNSRKNNILSQ